MLTLRIQEIHNGKEGVHEMFSITNVTASIAIILSGRRVETPHFKFQVIVAAFIPTKYAKAIPSIASQSSCFHGRLQMVSGGMSKKEIRDGACTTHSFATSPSPFFVLLCLDFCLKRTS